jgi:hypothetical protein
MVMLPTQAILNRYKFTESKFLDIILEVRNIVAEVAPDATEHIQGRGLTYFDASRGGHVSAGICQILLREDRVRLAFIHGAFLPDPQHLLRNEGERIAKRFVDIDTYDTARWEELRDLIRASAAFDPYSFEGNPTR